MVKRWPSACGGQDGGHSPFASVSATLDDHALHGATRLRLQLHNLCQRHRGLGEGQQVIALTTVTTVTSRWRASS